VKCSEVKDPLIVFNPEFFPLWEEVRKHYGIALAEDCAGFNCDKEVASILRKMFTTALELPKEIEIEEQIHTPTEEVSVERPKSVFLGHVGHVDNKEESHEETSLFSSRCFDRPCDNLREDEGGKELPFLNPN
jgi:hypothetical protein